MKAAEYRTDRHDNQQADTISQPYSSTFPTSFPCVDDTAHLTACTYIRRRFHFAGDGGLWVRGLYDSGETKRIEPPEDLPTPADIRLPWAK